MIYAVGEKGWIIGSAQHAAYSCAYIYRAILHLTTPGAQTPHSR